MVGTPPKQRGNQEVKGCNKQETYHPRVVKRRNLRVPAIHQGKEGIQSRLDQVRRLSERLLQTDDTERKPDVNEHKKKIFVDLVEHWRLN